MPIQPNYKVGDRVEIEIVGAMRKFEAEVIAFEDCGCGIKHPRIKIPHGDPVWGGAILKCGDYSLKKRLPPKMPKQAE